MATILEFRSGTRNSPLRARNLLEACEIVFFPGVRYDYAAPPMPSQAKAKRVRTNRKRDKLELKD